ncbi:MAG: mechanosensitive ion channel, partial [Lentisphaeria bacterium]|nr:mechanosensitive ion channel [Lentisphaeria bacterium]
MSDFFNQIWQIIVDSNLLNVLGAILILFVGYFAALVLGRKATDLMEKISGKFINFSEAGEILPVVRTAKICGRIVYGIVMLLAVLGCFSVLKLDAAAEPLQEFISKITAFLPNIAGALLLIFIAWVVSGLVRIFSMTLLDSIKLSSKLPLNKSEKLNNGKFALYVSKTAACIVYIFFLPAILDALKIYGITQPLQSMFEKCLTFIPNLLACALILFAGLWAANLARRAAKGFTVISKIDDLDDKFESSDTLRSGSLSAMIGWTVYGLVALPVVIAALTALDIDILSRAIAGFFRDVLDFSGEIAVSAILLLVVFRCGKFVGKIIERLTAAWGIDSLCCNMCKTLKLSVVAGKLTRIALAVLAVLVICDIFELSKASSLVRSFAVFGGNLILSSIVLLIGIKLANFAALMIKDKCNRYYEYAVKTAVII